MFISKTIFSRVPIKYNFLLRNKIKTYENFNSKKNSPISFGNYYIKNIDKKRDKQERLRIIKSFYDYILN